MAMLDLTLSGLRTPAASEAQERAFRGEANELTRRLSLAGTLVLLFGTVLWWPVDVWVMPDARHAEAFHMLRVRGLVGEVAIVAAMLALARWRAGVVPVGVVLYALVIFAFGHALGSLAPAAGGPPDASHFAYLGDAMFCVIPLAFAPMPLAWRTLVTSVIGVALLAGFFLPFPANRASPMATAQVSFLVFATLFSVIVGELWSRVVRALFMERWSLDHANRALAELTASLSEQVAERTASLRSLARHLDVSQEAERRRIAHDLHDDLGQHLSAMRYAVARLETRLTGEDAALVEDLSALLDGTSSSMRAVIGRLRPRILDDLGLTAALEWLCEDIAGRGVPCTIEIRPAFTAVASTLRPPEELALFRAVQESSTNALKHASATRLTVVLDADATSVQATLSDDGVGFDPAAPRAGFGLFGLSERIADLGGSARVATAPGQGTTVCVRLPLPGGA